MTRGRTSAGVSLLRLRSDDQLVALFRAGHDDAFRVIHDRYRTRLFAYTRQMLPGSRQDAEDALQDVFVKAYSGLRANDRELALRAWLYRVAHNRCIDQLRRPVPIATDALENRAASRSELSDPIAAAEQRETLRRLIADVRRLPEQQRSALLMRELSGMSYVELAEALGLSVPAVKSVLVRARVSLAAAYEARETACEEIRIELSQCHDRGVRPTATARRHMHDCIGCREFRASVRGLSRNFAALTPAIGPIGIIAKVFGVGLGGGAAAGGGGAAGTGGAAGGTLAVAGTGAAAAGGGTAAVAGGAIATGFMTTGHVGALLAAAVITAGGAVELQPTLAPAHHRAHHSAAIARRSQPAAMADPMYSGAVATTNVNSAVTEAATQHRFTPAAAATDHLTAPKKVRPSGGSIASGKALTPSGGAAGGGTETAGGTASEANGGTSTNGSAAGPAGADSGPGTDSGASSAPGSATGTAGSGTAGATGSTSTGTSGTGSSTSAGATTSTAGGESGTATGTVGTTGTSGTGSSATGSSGTGTSGTATSAGPSAGSGTSGTDSTSPAAGGGIDSHS